MPKKNPLSPQPSDLFIRGPRPCARSSDSNRSVLMALAGLERLRDGGRGEVQELANEGRHRPPLHHDGSNELFRHGVVRKQGDQSPGIQ